MFMQCATKCSGELITDRNERCRFWFILEPVFMPLVELLLALPK